MLTERITDPLFFLKKFKLAGKISLISAMYISK